MAANNNKDIDYRPLLQSIVEAIVFNALVTKEGFKHMSNDFSAMDAALGGVEQAIRDVAEAIANPAVDNNDQATIDGFTARLVGAADALAAAKAAEDAEDAGPAPAA
jgi:hypothetical protein